MTFGSKWWLKSSRLPAFVPILRTNTAITSSRSRWWSVSNHSSLSLSRSLSRSYNNWRNQVTLATKFTKRFWSSMVRSFKWTTSMLQFKRQKRRKGRRNKVRSLNKLPKWPTSTSTSMPTSHCHRCPNKPQCKGWWTRGSKCKQVFISNSEHTEALVVL